MVLEASNQQPAAGGIRTPWILKDDKERKEYQKRLRRENEREIGQEKRCETRFL